MKLSICIGFRPESTGLRERNCNRVKNHLLRIFENDPNYDVRLIVKDDPDKNHFNKGRALNECYLDCPANTDLLLFNDADVMISEGALKVGIMMAMSDDYGYVVPYTSIAYLNQRYSEQYHRTTHHTLKDLPDYTPDDLEMLWLNRSTGGCNLIKPKNFEAVKGFDSRFSVWGFEDSALDIAITTMIGSTGFVDHRAIHLWHYPSFRDGKWSTLREQGKKLCMQYEEGAGDKSRIMELIRERPVSFMK